MDGLCRLDSHLGPVVKVFFFAEALLEPYGAGENPIYGNFSQEACCKRLEGMSCYDSSSGCEGGREGWASSPRGLPNKKWLLSAFQGAWAKWGVPAGQGPLPGEGAILRPSQRSGPPSFPSSRPTQSFSIKHTFKEF